MSSVSSLHTGAHVTPVYLNLYDLGGCMNACVHSIGLSFYHCAVQTHSAEYGYMGHPYKFTGLYKTSKHDSRFHLYRLRDSIEVGWTWFSEKEIDQIVDDLKTFYSGYDYHTTKKNSIHFAKYLLEQLSNDPELKHLEPIKILHFPSYIDRSRRLTETLDFLQMFDTEKDIAEINILYFLYMKYEGNMKQICQILKCDTLVKLNRYRELINQGIRQKRLPRFLAFTTFEMKTAQENLYLIAQNNSDNSAMNEQLTLTDVFRQFDTITLRGRTSIDRYLNLQRAKEVAQQQTTMADIDVKHRNIPSHYQPKTDLSLVVDTLQDGDYHSSSRNYDLKDMTLSNIHRPLVSQALSHNQGRISRSISNISGLALRSKEQSNYSTTHSSTTPIFIDPLLKVEHLHMRTAVPVGTLLRLQETPNPDLPITELYLSTNGDQKSNKQRKTSYTSRKRKLPRDLELTNDLYTITNSNAIHQNYTNNAISRRSSFSQCQLSLTDRISYHAFKISEDIDSTV